VYPANRAGVSAQFADPSVRKSIDVDLTLIDQYNALIVDLELTTVGEAKRHDVDAFHRLRSVPGIGQVPALTILNEIHDITRFDRVQGFVSHVSAHLKARKSEAGKTRRPSTLPRSPWPAKLTPAARVLQECEQQWTQLQRELARRESADELVPSTRSSSSVTYGGDSPSGISFSAGRRRSRGK
jgi:Transposase IS116/IS110/IS902 family